MAALPPPPPASPPPTQAPGAPPGWTNIGGLLVPLIPGLTPQGAPPAAPGPVPPAANLQALAGKRCGNAEVGQKRIPLDCMTPQYGEIPWAQFAIVTRGWLNGRKGFVGDNPLPSAVDHRAEGVEGPVRDQGPVGACTAFSLAAAVDHAVSRQLRRPTAVSVTHAWARYHSPMMSRAADGNRGKVLTAEASWPYRTQESCSWMSPCDPGECAPGPACGQRPDAARIAKADEAPIAKINTITRLHPNDMEELKTVIAKGQDIWFAMYVGRSFHRVRGANAIVPDDDYRFAPSGHAMVLSGYRTQANGTYFLIHNSWGTDWGDGGYAWIHERTLQRNLRSAYIIEADPSTPAPPGPKPVPPPSKPPPPGGKAACGPGLQPDSVTEECVPPCADGSPRASGACGSKNGCAPGHVNIFGFCVLAAPPKPPSQDPVTGVKAMCGPSGCTYLLQHGQHGCQQFLCTHACPAPKFVLANGPNGLTCTE